MARKYEIKDLGEIHHVIGVKIDRKQPDTIRLSQKAYIDSIIVKYNMQECRPASTPLEPGMNINKTSSITREEKDEMANIPYRELIGSLMHLSQYTRPDTAFAISKLSQYNANPGKIHWTQAKHVLRYLNKTRDLELIYRTGNNRKIQVYCDVDWAGDQDDRHSYSGIVVMIGGNLIHWRSTKQNCLSTSTMESEYVALSSGVKEMMWLDIFLSELNMREFVTGIQVFCDNIAAIDFSRSKIEKNRTKYIDISYHLVREKVENGLLELSYVPSNENPADVMKGLKNIAYNKCVARMGLDIAK